MQSIKLDLKKICIAVKKNMNVLYVYLNAYYRDLYEHKKNIFPHICIYSILKALKNRESIHHLRIIKKKNNFYTPKVEK